MLIIDHEYIIHNLSIILAKLSRLISRLCRLNFCRSPIRALTVKYTKRSLGYALAIFNDQSSAKSTYVARFYLVFGGRRMGIKKNKKEYAACQRQHSYEALQSKFSEINRSDFRFTSKMQRFPCSLSASLPNQSRFCDVSLNTFCALLIAYALFAVGV